MGVSQTRHQAHGTKGLFPVHVLFQTRIFFPFSSAASLLHFLWRCSWPDIVLSEKMWGQECCTATGHPSCRIWSDSPPLILTATQTAINIRTIKTNTPLSISVHNPTFTFVLLVWELKPYFPSYLLAFYRDVLVIVGSCSFTEPRPTRRGAAWGAVPRYPLLRQKMHYSMPWGTPFISIFRAVMVSVHNLK